MEAKKSPRANLQSKRSLLLEIGLIVSVGAMLAVFSYSKQEKSLVQMTVQEAVIDPDVVIATVQEQKPVAPKTVFIPSVDVIQIVTNDVKISEELDFSVDIVDIVVPKIGTQKEEAVPDEIFVTAEFMPEFMGGDLTKFRSWVIGKLQYPTLAAENRVQGTVVLAFVIEKDGTLSNIEVLTSADSSLSEEAVRVLKSSPKWKPGIQRTTPVRVKYTLPVQFRLTD